MTEVHDPAKPPHDVVELKAAWLFVNAEIAAVAAEKPAGDVLAIAGSERRVLSQEQGQRFSAAQAQLAQLSAALFASSWRQAVSTGGGWSSADAALAEAAAVLVAELDKQSPSALRELADRLSSS